jgi:DNA repair exonuclease SbcCD ATPase subunit
MISFIELIDFGPFEKARLELEGQGLVYVTADNRDTDAADNNGSGKTSLFKALTWALYDDVIDGYGGDNVIRRGAKRATVNVGFVDGFKLERSRTKGKPRATLFNAKGEAVKLSKDDLRDEIVRRVGGLDFASFKNTVLYGQNDSKRFADNATKDADRKEILHRILKTEVLKRCHEWARKEALRLKHERDALVEKIDTLDAKREEHDVDALQRKFDAWQQENEEDVDEAVREAKGARNRAKELEGLKAKIPKLEAGVKKLDTALAACSKAGEEAEEIDRDTPRKAAETATETLHEARRAISTTKVKLEGVEDALAELDGDKCPVCTSPLDEGHALEHRKELAARAKKHKQALKRFEGDKTKAAKALEDASTESAKALAQYERKREKADDAPRLERERSHLRTEIAKAEAAEDRAADFVEQAQRALKRAKALKAEKNPFDGLLEEAKAKTKAFKQESKKHKQALDVVREDLAHFEFWVRGFGNQGLPSFVLDSIMPYLTERTNNYLGVLADGDITVEFSTQRALKSDKKEVRDEIEITWTIEGEEDVAPSGGQLKKIEISVGLALMDLVAAREGGGLDMIALDEVLDGLDREGRARVLQLLQDLRARRGSIFVISHETDVSEIFEKTVTVVKEGGVARLELAA